MKTSTPPLFPLALPVLLTLLSLIIQPVEAFNPPVDKVGPLTVRIEFPEVVDKIGVPIKGHVIIENEGKSPIAGQLTLEVVDRWTVRVAGTPAGSTRFYVDAAQDSSNQAKSGQAKPSITKISFTATAGEGTYSGTDGGNAIYYPIHAKATFTLDGEKKTAHPIHLLRTTFSRTPSTQKQSLPISAWKPLTVEADQHLRLLDERMHRTFVALRDKAKPPILKPTGFNGTDPQTGATSAIGHHRHGGDPTERVITTHPPYRAGLFGTVVREYPVRLPECRPIRLDFGVAVTASEKGDGVTFRVRVAPKDAPAGQLGEVAFARHSNKQKGWDDCSADLSRFAGREVRIQLEADPGPKGNSGWDSSFWSRLLLTAGSPKPERPFPPKKSDGFHRLGMIQSSGHSYMIQVRPGNRGLLDADVGFLREDGQKLYFRGFEIHYAGKRIDSGETSVRLIGTTSRTEKGFYETRHRFLGEHGPMDLLIRLYLKDDTLKVAFDQTHERYFDVVSGGACPLAFSDGVNSKNAEASPAANGTKKVAPPAWTPIHLEDISTGPWSVQAKQIYHGFGHVVRNPKAYRLPFEGHHQPTSFVGFDFADTFSMVQAVDNVPISIEVRPEEHHYSLHVPYCPTLTFIPTHNAFAGAKRWRAINGLKASSGVRKAAGRFVFDLWGGRYEDSRKKLEKAFRYGLTDSMVIWHNWQRWGYDYRLPEIYPSQPGRGTEKEMQQLIHSCKAVGVPFALHDNYIDMYPDAESFSYEKHVGFNSNGTPRRAWLNKGRKALSYKYNPRSVMQFLKPNLKLIRDNLAPTAYFIDVWSSVGPSEYWTVTGRLVTRQETRKIWGEAFAWIRDYLGDDAPQISESGHDQLIGYLDGAQTNHLRIESPKDGRPYSFVVYLDCEEHDRTCWFDTAHHDRFILHGAGYSNRYAGGFDQRIHGIYSDDYISTEVLTGHPGMVSLPFSNDVVRKYWLMSPLMRALALRTIEQVDFEGGPSGNLHRQHVTWSGNAHVWVNRGESDWKVEGCTLPKYGFLARVPTEAGMVEASIERRDGLIVEQATSPKHFYVNARQIVDPCLKAKLLVEKVQREGNRLKISMKAVIHEKAPEGYQLFFHINRDDKIVEQPAHDNLLFSREPGEYRFTITSSLPSYAKSSDELLFTYGLWDSSSGRRYPLIGLDDGTHRICLGTFEVPQPRKSSRGNSLNVAWKPASSGSTKLEEWKKRFNQNDRLVNFGPVTTNGGCRLTKKGKNIIVTPLPSNKSAQQTIRINYLELPWHPLKVGCVVSLDEQGASLSESKIIPRKEGFFIEIKHNADVFEYRLIHEEK